MMSRDSGSERPQRTVAELLAEYGGSSGDAPRRRRRRAEDDGDSAPQTIIERVLSDSGKLLPVRDDGPEPQQRGSHGSHRGRGGTSSRLPVPPPGPQAPPSGGGGGHRAPEPPAYREPAPTAYSEPVAPPRPAPVRPQQGGRQGPPPSGQLSGPPQGPPPQQQSGPLPLPPQTAPQAPSPTQRAVSPVPPPVQPQQGPPQGPPQQAGQRGEPMPPQPGPQAGPGTRSGMPAPGQQSRAGVRPVGPPSRPDLPQAGRPPQGGPQGQPTRTVRPVGRPGGPTPGRPPAPPDDPATAVHPAFADDVDEYGDYAGDEYPGDEYADQGDYGQAPGPGPAAPLQARPSGAQAEPHTEVFPLVPGDAQAPLRPAPPGGRPPQGPPQGPLGRPRPAAPPQLESTQAHPGPYVDGSDLDDLGDSFPDHPDFQPGRLDGYAGGDRGDEHGPGFDGGFETARKPGIDDDFDGEDGHRDERDQRDLDGDGRRRGRRGRSRDDLAGEREPEIDGRDDLPDPDDYDEAEHPSTTRQWFLMAAQVGAGAVGGAAVWLAFSWLWGTQPVVAVVAALLVIVGLVLGLRRLRRADDLQTTVLAILAGLVVTVSPAALLLLRR